MLLMMKVMLMVKVNRSFRRCLLQVAGVMLVAVMPSAHLAAQTTVVVPCDLDNTLYESPTGSFSNALGESLFVGVTAQGLLRRALLRFDVAAALPAGCHVVAATLALNVVASGAAVPTAVAGHRVSRPWGEGASYALAGGGGMGAPSTNGDATWIHAAYPSTPWNHAGGDFCAAASFVMSMPILGPTTSEAAVGATADVQHWLEHPLQNHGWLLKAVDEVLPVSRARRIDSRQSLGPRPALTITVTVA
jgi:hypothetical protein